jgi:hypothetical protein
MHERIDNLLAYLDLQVRKTDVAKVLNNKQNNCMVFNMCISSLASALFS